jgi:ABC-type multidrug transport system ATPase subunit
MNAAEGADTPSDFTAVSVAGVSRYYGRRRALSKVSIECRAGTMTGLFGPNGAGKSTLLGVLSTLIEPSQGVVRYGDRSADEWGDALRARVGVLGHDLFLYGDLTARENLEFFGRLHGIPRLAARIDEALAAARLTDRAGDRVGAFSRGLRQRLALERALIHDPRLVLLDEPFTGLDDASTGLLSARLRTLRASGAIVVMATHDFDTADGLVDHAVCLENGRLTPIVAGEGRLRERYRRTLQEVVPR